MLSTAKNTSLSKNSSKADIRRIEQKSHVSEQETSAFATEKSNQNDIDYNLNDLSLSQKPYSIIQTKLKIGAPGDRYEQEADRIAEQVLNMPEPDAIRNHGGEQVQRKPLTDQISGINYSKAQRKCSKCKEEEEELIQRKASGNTHVIAGKNLVSGLQSSRGKGQKMDLTTNTYMSSRFGVDFSQVRIHNNAKATEMSQGINARAFTRGNDIYFNKGQYSPQTSEGKRLLAHELVHTVQQQKKDNFLQKKPGSPAGGCGVCYGSPKNVGLAAHKLIQAGLKTVIPIFKERVVPYTSGTHGKLDIAVPGKKLDTILIGEIKPNNANGKKDGKDKLDEYTKELVKLGMIVVPLVVPPKFTVPFPTLLKKGPKCPQFHKMTVISDRSTEGLFLYDCSPDFKELKKRGCKCPWEKDKKKKKKKKNTKKKKGKVKTKAPKSKPGAKAGAYNVGFGINILGSGGGAGNAGVGISIMSNGVSVGTVSAGIVYDSNGAAIGSASVGISSKSTGVAAGTASAGKSENSLGASAGVASVGSSKNQKESQAGAAGKTDKNAKKASKHGLKIPGKSQAEVDKAVKEAGQIEEKLKKASPAQRRLIEQLAGQSKGGYQTPDSQWVDKLLKATDGITDKEAEQLAANMDLTPKNTSANQLKNEVNIALGKGKGKGKEKGKVDGEKEEEGKGKGAEKTPEKAKQKTDTKADESTKFKSDQLNPQAKKVFEILLDKKGATINNELLRLNKIIPKDITEAQLAAIKNAISSDESKEKSISEILDTIEIILSNEKLKQAKGARDSKKEKKKNAVPIEKFIDDMVKKIKSFKGWKKTKGFKINLSDGKKLHELKDKESAKGILYRKYRYTDMSINKTKILRAAAIVHVKVISKTRRGKRTIIEVEVIKSTKVVLENRVTEKPLTGKKFIGDLI